MSGVVRFGGGQGGGPREPSLEARVAGLEVDMKDVKASLGRLELVFARFDEKVAHLATKEDVSRVETRLVGEISEVRGRVASLPTTWQIIGILAALLVGISALVFATDNFLERSRAPSTLQQSTKS